MWGNIMISMGIDYTAYMDYMDHAVCCPKKLVKLNHSLILWNLVILSYQFDPVPTKWVMSHDTAISVLVGP